MCIVRVNINFDCMFQFYFLPGNLNKTLVFFQRNGILLKWSVHIVTCTKLYIAKAVIACLVFCQLIVD